LVLDDVSSMAAATCSVVSNEAIKAVSVRYTGPEISSGAENEAPSVVELR